ncbi:MAG TPA: DUF29 family protein [Agitococcus sp.]|nr:DUF29 family protein [Agitococcus sp.]
MNSSKYQEDFYAWTQEQAQLLRSRQLAKIDIANLVRQRTVTTPTPTRTTSTSYSSTSNEKKWVEKNPGCLISILCFVIGGILLANDVGFGGVLIFIGLFAHRIDD